MLVVSRFDGDSGIWPLIIQSVDEVICDLEQKLIREPQKPHGGRFDTRAGEQRKEVG